jgi:hypothetical protein
MLLRWSLLLTFTTGCDLVFTLDPPEDIPDAGDRDAGDRDAGDPAFPHLPASVTIGEADVVFSVATRIRTDVMTIEPALLAAQIVLVGQAGGPELVVIRGRDVTIAADVIVDGTRPLVIVGREITISGLLDASANLELGGPGSHTIGPSIGGDGARVQVNASGGGGGGFGPGARIGGFGGIGTCASPLVAGGDGGLAVDDPELQILQGGGAGGLGGLACGTPGGGGGGALQLSALERIAVTGTIDAGGGGGVGGIACTMIGELADGGSGGGAGGAIYLDAPAIDIAATGVLAANGGGGGGGGCDKTGENGVPGEDARRTETFALGGVPIEGCSGQGGLGAFGAAGGTAGASISCDGQAGGGGAAVGRIVLRGVVTQNGIVTPPGAIVAR